jgi:hemolysin activation/secretion protein
LISGEQFGLGGVRSVRGFDEREVSGDSAQQLNLEVWTPPLFYNIRLLGFLDAGWLQFDKAFSPGMPDREALASVGLGLRWQWKSNLSVSLDLACAVNGADTTDAGDGKLHFNIFFRF